MKKTIYNKFDKTKIASLPRVLFGGRIVVVCTEREAEKEKVFRLNLLGMSPSVRRLLEDTKVPKIGLSLRDDLNSLHKLDDFQSGYFIDLQDHVREIGVEDMSLQKLYANFFGQRISKREQLTNWEADILNDKQKAYAATDAWTCILLYEELMRLEQTGDYELIKITEDVQANTTPQG